MSDYFKFEDKEIDFPYYNDNPKMDKKGLFALILGILCFIAILECPFYIDSNIISILFCLVLLIPLIYLTKGELGLFFRKINSKDIELIILCLVGYFLYSMILVTILSQLGIAINTNEVYGANNDIFFWISIIIQILGEELLKLIIFIISLRYIYRFTKNRKMSVVLAFIFALLIFGLLHYHAYNGSLIQIIFVIGLGSAIYFYPYIKTKNLLPSYIIHLLIDGLIFGITIFASSMGMDLNNATAILFALI